MMPTSSTLSNIKQSLKNENNTSEIHPNKGYNIAYIKMQKRKIIFVIKDHCH